MSDFSVRGELGDPLRLSITEEIHEYDPQSKEKFHLGGWRSCLPPREAMRPEKYVRQAGPPFYWHFGEITAFNELLQRGWEDAFYERLKLFSEPPHGIHARYKLGTEEFRRLIDEQDYDKLRTFGIRYSRGGAAKFHPKEPDLVAYKTIRGRTNSFFGVEVKWKDTVKNDQLLGLALLHKVLGSEIAIWRYMPTGAANKTPKNYCKTFEPHAVDPRGPKGK